MFPDIEKPIRRDPPDREPAFNLAGVVVFALALLGAIHAARIFLFSPQMNDAVIVIFGFFPAGGMARPLDWIDLVTHSLLHADATHLLVNAIWLAAFGSPLAARIGWPRFIAFWMATAAAGALMYLAFNPESGGVLVGASGAISGMTGAAARFGFRVDRTRRPSAFSGALQPLTYAVRSPSVLSFLAVWMAINLVAGSGVFTGGAAGPAIAWEAHLGGFLTGFLGVGLFDRKL
ncbi:MAG: rhomboid family intramembrane serine protease [Phyllobacteriaceae bacterium]|nr:rhomboid family intramembrane serine protease [Phyllobacteriaceae bacterium]